MVSQVPCDFQLDGRIADREAEKRHGAQFPRRDNRVEDGAAAQRAIGVEIDPLYHRLAKERLRAVGTLFSKTSVEIAG